MSCLGARQPEASWWPNHEAVVGPGRAWLKAMLDSLVAMGSDKADASDKARHQTHVESLEIRTDIRLATNGDHDAFRRLIECHQQEIGRFLWRFTHDRLVWDELVQAVFVEAFLNLRKFRGDARFLDWLRGIATHLGYRHWTARRKDRERLTPLSEIKSPAESTAGKAAAPSLGLFDLLEHLPPRDRLVLTLLYVEERSLADAAVLTGWRESTVKSQAHRARLRLKELWERHHGT